LNADALMKPDREIGQFCATMSEKWPRLTRREAVVVGGVSIVGLLTTFETASADSEFRIEVRPQDDSANLGTWRQTDQKTESYEKRENDIGKEIGIGYRAPVCGMQKLTPVELFATRTPERAPGYLSVSPESYFAEDAARSFSNDAGSYLVTAMRKIGEAHGDNSRSAVNQAVNDNQILMYPFGVYAIASRPYAQFLKSVEWGGLLHATVEKAIDVAKGKIVEDIARHLTGIAEGPAFIISTLVDVATPTSLWEPELTYMDRLSPAERREFLNEVFKMKPIVEPPLDGPVLRNGP
jgi:hypothetical protein